MINFRDRAFIVPSALIVLSILILAATLAYAVLIPPPTTNGLARGRAASVQSLKNEINSAQTRTAQAAQQITPLVWAGNSDMISGAVLEQMTAKARQEALSISAFRPQKTNDVGGVTELPFTVQLSGAYSGVRGVMESLDASGTRIVLRSAQIGSAATGSGVTATLGLTAYVLTSPPAAPAAPAARTPAAAAPASPVAHGPAATSLPKAGPHG
jgi:hypothetical protein